MLQPQNRCNIIYIPLKYGLFQVYLAISCILVITNNNNKNSGGGGGSLSLEIFAVIIVYMNSVKLLWHLVSYFDNRTKKNVPSNCRIEKKWGMEEVT